MEHEPLQIELQIWREGGDSGAWRCRVRTPGAFHTVRLLDHETLSAYIASQLELISQAASAQPQEEPV